MQRKVLKVMKNDVENKFTTIPKITVVRLRSERHGIWICKNQY